MTKSEFNNLILQHTDSLRSYAVQFTRDQEDSQDLLQDTMLKAILYSGKFKEGTNLKGWLYTIMKNTFINNYRRIVKSNTFIDRTEELSSPQLLKSSSTNGGENSFVRRDIQNAVEGLIKDHSTPFTMYFEGYRYHEISDALTIPIGTVKTRIHMARKLLKNQLKTYRPN